MKSQPETIRAIAERMADQPGALLPILHGVQDELGYLPAATAAVVAQVLNLSRAEVHGVISFYHLFRDSQPGRRTIYLCRSEACQAMGGARLAEHVKSRLGIGWHDTSDDGRFSLEPIYCLGNCALSPAMMVDRTLHGRVTPESFDALVGESHEDPPSGR